MVWFTGLQEMTLMQVYY